MCEKRTVRIAAWLGPVAVAAGCWSTARPVTPARDVKLDARIEQLRLANGMRVVVVPEATPGRIAITMRYGVGAGDDPPGQEGMAHLVEHVMFEHVRGDEALFDHLEAHALSFNGHTTADATLYTEEAATAELADLLELEAARLELPCSAIPQTSFERQREIVRNELREHERDADIAYAMENATFGSRSHSYARLATVDTIGAISHEQLCAFAARYYSPGNAVLVVSGDVEAAAVRPILDRTLGHVPAGAAPPPGAVDSPVAPHRATVEAPVDRAWLVLSWPLPADPVERERVRAVTEMLRQLVAARVAGTVASDELGAGDDRRIALEIAPASVITLDDALDGARSARFWLTQWFSSGLYEFAQSNAMLDLLTRLEHGVSRDAMLAEEAADGREVAADVQAELAGLSSLDRDGADHLAGSALAFDRATIVTLRPGARTAGPSRGHLLAPFDEQRRRAAVDPRLAHAPAAAPVDRALFARVRTRMLPDGMHVILLPLSTVPTVDIRLVFDAGSAQEASDDRGVATVAAHAIEPPPEAWPDMQTFGMAGGVIERDIGWDHTAFVVRGLSAYVDKLLLGLKVTIMEGVYDQSSTVEVARELTLREQADKTTRFALHMWRVARYGEMHPYVLAGRWERASRRAYDLATVRTFRAMHYQPDRATLVISGGFDPDVVDHWIDFYFGAWYGHGSPSTTPAAKLQPMALAQPLPTTQVQLHLAFDASGVGRGMGLVAAEMIDETIADAREELAATYGLHARYVELSGSRTIEIDGSVDPARAADVIRLLTARLHALGTSSDEVASLFVSARRRVMERLASVDLRAEELGDRVVDDLDAGMTLATDLDTVDDVRRLTIDQLTPTLARLDPASAASLLRGPKPALDAAFAALGRDPYVLPTPR